MPDLLPPRLIARVERSLRKRIDSDILPHLLRLSAQAASVDEFMASAARLLLNPREREQWLASWAHRTQLATEHSLALASATGPDTTSPAGLDTPVQRSFHLTGTELEQVRQALAQELGPVAELLVESEAKHAESGAELLVRLQSHLLDDHQRARFVQTSQAVFSADR